jgi:hypothetical protein
MLRCSYISIDFGSGICHSLQLQDTKKKKIYFEQWLVRDFKQRHRGKFLTASVLCD